MGPCSVPETMAALAVPSRRGIIVQLGLGGRSTVAELAGRLHYADSTVRRQLGILGDRGLVRMERGAPVRFELTEAVSVRRRQGNVLLDIDVDDGSHVRLSIPSSLLEGPVRR